MRRKEGDLRNKRQGHSWEGMREESGARVEGWEGERMG